jgi:hypothetical protein
MFASYSDTFIRLREAAQKETDLQWKLKSSNSSNNSYRSTCINIKLVFLLDEKQFVFYELLKRHA